MPARDPTLRSDTMMKGTEQNISYQSETLHDRAGHFVVRLSYRFETFKMYFFYL